MVDFRRWILALAVLALFAGLASAQVGGVGSNNQFTCATNVSSVPVLRAEGLTEQTGDITITCTGGNPVAIGSQIPTVNITVILAAQITSRLLSGNVSEALLLIDEPGSTSPAPVAGFGPGAPQRVCGVAGTFFGATGSPTLGSPATGCTEFAMNTTTTAAAGSLPATVAVDVAGVLSPGANVFQGIVNPNGINQGNQVTFFGVPVLPPVSANISRVFRITNIRVNATQLQLNGQAAAQLTVSNPSALPITSSIPVVGFVQTGLLTSTSGTATLQQCVATSNTLVSNLTFRENFATAFKTRIVATSNTLFAGQGVPTTTPPGNQNVPGSIYNSESNFVLTTPASSQQAGLADFGTRLKATFNSVPPGVRLFVSVANVTNFVPAPPGGSTGNSVAASYALFVPNETASDGTGSTFTVPTAGATIEIPVDATGHAQAVWEVINTSPSSLDSLTFQVFTTFAANTAGIVNTGGTVNLSFAPTPLAFTAAAGATASSTLAIPRFLDTSTAIKILNINVCRTVLLYPFITNQSGFDTGIAIANTSTDPFSTSPQSGTCSLNWFGGTVATPLVPPLATTTASVASGTVFVDLASIRVPTFQGYMIAICNFQYAHGFAFISDVGAQKLAMGYLALVIPDPGSSSSIRTASPPCQGIAGCTSSGENTAH